MKRFLLMITVLFFTLCPLSAQPAEKSAISGTEIRQREQYERSMEERFRKLGRELDELKVKAATMTRHARKEINRSLADAEKKRTEVSRKLDERKAEGKKKWDTFVNEMNAAMEEFEKAFERAKSHFRE